MPKRLGLDNGESLSLTIGKNWVNNSWYLNYSSSYHMCSSRDLFIAYKPHAGGSTFMETNAKLTSIGIWTVKIWMFDRIVHTLID